MTLRTGIAILLALSGIGFILLWLTGHIVHEGGPAEPNQHPVTRTAQVASAAPDPIARQVSKRPPPTTCSEPAANEAKDDTRRSTGDATRGRGESPSPKLEETTGVERAELIRRLIHSAFRTGKTDMERIDLMWSLIDMGGEDVATALVEEFRTCEPEDRREIIDTLSGHFEEHVPAVAESLADLIRNSSNADLRGAAADSLRDLHSLDLGPEGAPVRAALRAGLSDSGPLVRVRCAALLVQDGDVDRALLEALRSGLQDDGARLEAIDGLSWAALASKPEEASRIALELVAQLGSADAEVRSHAMTALGESGVETAAVRSACLRGLGDSVPGVRVAALHALAELPNPTDEVLLAIERLLEDESTRMAAVSALATAGPTAVRTARKIALLAEDGDGSISDRGFAIQSLREIRCPDSVPALTRLTEDREHHVRADATAALGYFREDTAAIVPFVIKRLGDERSRVVLAALGALSRFEDSQATALPALQKLLVRDSNEAWGRDISKYARKMIERLAREHPDESVRGAATQALKGGG